MRQLTLLACCLLLAGTTVTAQSTWKKLARVTYVKQYDEFLGMKVDVPVFAESVKAMDGQTITLSGYIIPLEGMKSQKEFIFSAVPYSMCFFCGGAGPESVMEIFAKEPVKYTSEKIKLRGRLELNATDINRLIYILHDVEQVE